MAIGLHSPRSTEKIYVLRHLKKLWEAIRRSHSKRGDKAKIIDLISRSYSLWQGDKDIETYSNELRTIQVELDYCWPQ